MRGEHVQRAVLLSVTAALVVAVAAGVWTRRAVVESWMGYLPREHQLFVVTGDLATLWTTIDEHFGAAIRDTERQGWLASLARSAGEPFRESGVPIHGLADLERHGFDVSQGGAWSFGLPGRAEPDVFLLFPVADRARMLDWFRALQDGAEPERHVVEGPGGSVELLEFDGEAWIAFPEAGVAVLTDSRALLERSVSQHTAGLRWWRNNDAMVEALSELAGAGGKAIVHWAHGAAPLRTATAVLTLDDATVRVDVTARLYRGGLQIVEDLMQGDARRAPAPSDLPGEVAALLTLDDVAISRYLRFMGRFSGAAHFMNESYGGVLASLRDTAGLEQVAVAVTGYRDGLPEIVLALRGDSAALERMVRGQQRRLAEQRDRSVLAGALARWVAGGGDPDAASVAAFEARGLLVPDPALGDYGFVARPEAVEGLLVEGLPADERFAGEAYHRGELRFLAPPRNGNDVRYLLGGDADAPADETAFLDDRFRLATMRVDGGIWLATDAHAFETLSAAGPPPDSPVWEPLMDSKVVGKAWAGVDVGRLIELGLLTPEPDVREATRHYLMDFAGHPAGLARLRTNAVTGTVRFELVLARGAALTGAP